MKVEIEQFTSDATGKVDGVKLKGNITQIQPTEVIYGYTYYLFKTEEKAWIRHSGKLTKEEKQWVIQNETKI